MLAALSVVLPLGLAGAVSPVMLTEQTVLLAGPDGERAGVRYAAGVVVTLLVVVCAVTLVGRAFSLPTEPKLNASLDLVLGLLLLLLAIVVHAFGRRREATTKRRTDRAETAFPFGAFSMATNFTTLGLMLPAAKEISGADVDLGGRALLVLVLVALATTPAWLPVILSRAARGRRMLAGAQTLIDRHGRSAVVALLSAGALFFIGRGTIRLLG